MNANWDITKDNTIQWNSVNTDPSTLDIFLVNNVVNPSVSVSLARNIATSQGSLLVTAFSLTNTGFVELQNMGEERS